jgi:sugar phosphate isomerase/epimerase
MTTNPWSLEQSLEGYVKAGVTGITAWRHHIEPYGVKEAARMIRESGLQLVSLCRGGYFCATSGQAREEAKAENHRIIDEAVALGAPLVVLVPGAVPGLDLAEARHQIIAAIMDLLPHAQDAGIKLGIEPLHPMYADNRSAINTLEQANNIVTALDNKHLGVVIDVYHLWWDPFLKAEIERAGKSIFAFHVSDWRTPTEDILNDRGLMGEGCINIRQIRGWVEGMGFTGPIEVEIFSNRYWSQDQASFVERIKRAYLEHV